MKIVKRIIFYSVFVVLTVLIAIYTYAYFDKLPLDSRQESITMYDINGDVMYESNLKKNNDWIDINEIPSFIQDAFTSVEDKRFYYHAGFDPIRITKALATNFIRGDIVQGGSTITQQYAKNLFLTNEQTVTRKVEEFFYATRLEMQYSKADILEGYLNTLYYGHGVYGIKAAADYFYGKNLADLSVGETAMLIGIPNGPSLYSPFLHPDYAKQRQALILSILLDSEVIDEASYEVAKNEPLQLAEPDQKKTIGNDEYYIESVIAELKAMKGIDMNDGLQVYTNYDPDVQAVLQEAIHSVMGTEDELECSAIVTQPFSGNILAIAGGKDYTISQYNRAVYSQRQVASTIKPLLYYTALQQGFTPSTSFTSQPTNFQIGDDEEPYAPQNYDNKYPYRDISMINAIAMSDNIYAVKTHMFLGTQTLHNALLDFCIKQAIQTPSEALGTVNMSILELSRIYNTFASEGLYTNPSFIQRITSNDEDVYVQSTQPKRLLDRDTTLVLNQALTATYDLNNKTYAYPTMAGYSPTTEVGVKSGTSDWDSWAIGFNPQYTVGVWTGFDDNRDLTKEYYTLSKTIFKKTFNGLYPDQEGPWYQPSDAIEEHMVDPISGQSSSNGSLYWYLNNR